MDEEDQPLFCSFHEKVPSKTRFWLHLFR